MYRGLITCGLLKVRLDVSELDTPLPEKVSFRVVQNLARYLYNSLIDF